MSLERTNCLRLLYGSYGWPGYKYSMEAKDLPGRPLDLHHSPLEGVAPSGSMVIKREPDDSASDRLSNKSRKGKYISSSRARVVALKNELHDKGNLLATTWTELNQLLGEYQAELYANEETILSAKDGYEGVTDVESLRNELADKDGIIRELEERLAHAESKIQSIGLDLSVKNSLLNKYQQELLEKDATLLQTQTQLNAKKHLETRNRLLEMRVKKLELAEQPLDGTGTVTNVTVPSSSASNSAPAPKRRSPGTTVLQGSSKRKALAPKPSPKEVITLDDENEMDDLITNDDHDDSVNHFEPWPDGDNGHSVHDDLETTPQGSLPGSATPPDQEGGQIPLVVDGTVPESAIQGWELQPSTSAESLAHAENLAQFALAQSALLTSGDQEKSIPQHKTHHVTEPRRILPKPWLPTTEATTSDTTALPTNATMNLESEMDASFRNLRNRQCGKCDKTFMNTQDMFRHNVEEHGAKTYECPYCDKTYSRMSIWNQHVDTHTGVKRYACEWCGQEFSMRNSRYRHVRSYCKVRNKRL